MRVWLLILSCLLFPAEAGATARLTGDLPRRNDATLHDLAGLESEYGAVRTSEGTRLRTILTRPAGARTPLPALFVAQWVSCGTIDFAPDRSSQLRELARRSGMVMIRVERSGTGDSEGVPCAELDYDTEVRHYREALDRIARHAWVDPDRIVILGISLGATTAPLIAEGRRVAGLLVQGGGALTYVERMIQFDRIQLERSGEFRPDQVQPEMLRRIPFHYEYLVGGRTPAEVEAGRPELRGVWSTIRGAEPGSHYGRPFAWHQQAARRDFLAAWARIEAPVMVIYGEYDQFETRHGHRLIVDTIDRLRPGTATFVEIPGADHDLDTYPTAEAAYRGEGGQQRLEQFLEPALAWLRRVTGR
ncbi:MAG: alpha/beta hydrolase [Allosphingosinicella sp.]